MHHAAGKSITHAAALRLEPKPVQRHPEDVLGLSGVGGWDLGDPDDQLDDLADGDVRADDAGLLGAQEQRLTR